MTMPKDMEERFDKDFDHLELIPLENEVVIVSAHNDFRSLADVKQWIADECERVRKEERNRILLYFNEMTSLYSDRCNKNTA